jgi:hypothetical protein
VEGPLVGCLLGVLSISPPHPFRSLLFDLSHRDLQALRSRGPGRGCFEAWLQASIAVLEHWQKLRPTDEKAGCAGEPRWRSTTIHCNPLHPQRNHVFFPLKHRPGCTLNPGKGRIPPPALALLIAPSPCFPGSHWHSSLLIADLVFWCFAVAYS